MKTPSFWQKKNLLSNILLPIGFLYTLATKLNILFSHPKKVSKPVICIGNLTAGGSGKTPVAISLAAIIQELGYTPFFVSRGYGGKLKNIIVDNKKHTAAETGDEPLLLSYQAPVVVNADRYAAAKKAISAGADLILMDDGFQNPGLYKDFSFLVFDGSFGYGNKRGIPSGPLRETLKSGLKRAQAIIILGEDKHNLAQEFSYMPVFKGKVVASPISGSSKKNVIAFAGIGRPEKFYNSMKEEGFTLLKTIDYPDHHQYSEEELEYLINEAQKHQADLYTTTKDFVKISPHLQKNFNTLEISIQWENPNGLKEMLKNLLKKHM